jgi:hypothetical protein
MAAPAPSAPGRKVRTPEQRRDFEQQIKLDAAANERRKDLWHALNLFISRNGGFLVSQPYSKQLLVEVPEFSDLPGKLFDLGYDLRLTGATTRIVAGGFMPVECFSFTIPLVR